MISFLKLVCRAALSLSFFLMNCGLFTSACTDPQDDVNDDANSEFENDQFGDYDGDMMDMTLPPGYIGSSDGDGDTDGDADELRIDKFTNGFSDAVGWASGAYYWDTIQFTNLDNWVQNDICGRADIGIVCAKGTSPGFSPLSAWITHFSDAEGWNSAEYYWGTIQFVDVNGDNRADVCGRGSSGIYCATSTGSSFTNISLWTPHFSNAEGWAGAEYYWRTIQFVDVNDDNKADVCGRGSSGIICATSTGSSFANPNLWTTHFSNAEGWASSESYWGTIQFQDLNWDGEADVCGRASTGIYCATANHDSFRNYSRWSPNFSNAQGWNQNAYRWKSIKFNDINSDDVADICGISDNAVICEFSNGRNSFIDTRHASMGTNASLWTGQEYYWGTFDVLNTWYDLEPKFCIRGSDGVYCATPDDNVPI